MNIVFFVINHLPAGLPAEGMVGRNYRKDREEPQGSASSLRLCAILAHFAIVLLLAPGNAMNCEARLANDYITPIFKFDLSAKNDFLIRVEKLY